MPKYRNEDTLRCLAREMRVAKGLKQKDVADSIGMNQSEYSKIERGNRKLFGEDLVLLSNYFEVTTDELLGLSDAQGLKPITRQPQRDLLMYYIKGSNIGVDMSNKNTSLVERPFFLDGCDGCATVVINNRMSPRYDIGETVYIDFDQDIGKDDYCFIVFNNDDNGDNIGLLCQSRDKFIFGGVFKYKFENGEQDSLDSGAIEKIGKVVGSRS